jgi:cobalt/nickel transport system ATP-binding protein
MIELLKTFKHTKIIATHDLDMAYEMCDRIMVMHEGRIAADGTPSDIFSDEKLLYECGLEKPLSMS